jgi:thiol-disulfide isomerase/thioredoxin
LSGFGHSDFVILSSFGLRHSSFFVGGPMSEPRIKNDRAWWFVALGFLIAFGLFRSVLLPRMKGGLPPPRLAISAEPRKADFQWAVHDLNDVPVPFSRFQGKAIFLNIWATWCPPCVAELPSISRLAADPRLKEVAFVCVAIDDAPAAVRDFVHGKGWPMTILHATSLPDVFITEGIPATFLIDPDGRIVAAEVGGADWNDPPVIAFLEKLARPAAEGERKP